MNLFTIIFLLGTFFTSLYPFSVREISLPPLEQSAARFGIFALISGFILFFVHQYRNWLSIFRYPIWIIAIVNAISTLTSYISYLKLNIGTAVTTYYIYPIFLFLLGVFFGKERVTAKKVMALLVAFAGVIVVHWDDLRMVGPSRDYIVGLVAIIV
jgi:drug/metabolite transporter (DMT)-like permease